MYLLILTYLYCKLEVQGESLGFSKDLNKARNEVKKLETSQVYQQVQKGIPLEDVLKNLKVA